MIGIIMTIFLLICAFTTADTQASLLYFIAAGIFYIGFVQSTK